jgi:hypothetical protein
VTAYLASVPTALELIGGVACGCDMAVDSPQADVQVSSAPTEYSYKRLDHRRKEIGKYVWRIVTTVRGTLLPLHRQIQGVKGSSLAVFIVHYTTAHQS